LLAVLLIVTSCTKKPGATTGQGIIAEHKAVIVGDNKKIPEKMKPSPSEKESYLQNRAALISKEKKERFDTDITLNDDEQKVDEILHMLKDEMLFRYYARGFFPPANSFFKAMADIESSRVLNVLRDMPKGGMLNLHTFATGDMHWIVEYAVKHPNCYVYWYEDSKKFLKGQLGFYKPGTEPAGFNLASEIKDAIPYFEQQLYGLLTLNENDYKAIDINVEFSKCFKRIVNFLAYKPAFIDYYTKSFESIINDNIQYVELRAYLTPIYDVEGNSYPIRDTVKILRDIRDKLKEKYPDFDLKLIMTYSRLLSTEIAWDKLVDTMELKKEFGDFIVGFDLIGDEFSGRPTSYYLDNWLSLKNLEKAYGFELPLYLHDGMSNWSFNMNMYDAYLLNSERIGHGLTLFRSPILEEEIKKRDIALEISPISNQVLKLVSDLRTHPANGYLSRGVQCVIGSDYMGFYGYNNPTFDFWEAFMAWDLDLKALKKLAMNSIEYSAMTDDEKKAAMSYWQSEWDSFVDNTIKNYKTKFGGH
jgi:adenosine deaminase CECR1